MEAEREPDLSAFGVLLERRLSPPGHGNSMYAGRFMDSGRTLPCVVRLREGYRQRNDDECVRLEHPNIVRTLAAGIEPHSQKHFVVSQAHSGSTLSQLLSRIRPGDDHWLPAPAVLHIALSLLEAMAYSHRLEPPFRFCGCPPGRVLLTSNGSVRLLPNRMFGGSRQNLAYVPPEQLLGQAIVAQSDLYGVALVVFETLSGRHPILHGVELHENTLETLLLLRKLEPKALPPSLEAGELSRVLLKALARRPQDRPTSARALQHELLASWPFAGTRAEGAEWLAQAVSARGL